MLKLNEEEEKQLKDSIKIEELDDEAEEHYKNKMSLALGVNNEVQLAGLFLECYDLLKGCVEIEKIRLYLQRFETLEKYLREMIGEFNRITYPKYGYEIAIRTRVNENREHILNFVRFVFFNIIID